MLGNKLPFVLSDCDRTISHHDLSIDKDTIKSIKQYQKKSGYKFAFVTGRLDVANRKIAKQLKVQMPIIACNGAIITDLITNDVLFADYLDKTATAAVFREAATLEIDIIAYVPGAMVGVKGSERLTTWENYLTTVKKKEKFDINYYPDLNAIADAIENEEVKPVELVVFSSSKTKQKVARMIFDKYTDIFDTAQSLPQMFNAMNKGTNKLSGIKKWAEIIGVDYRDIVTFGDNHNDIEMVSGVNKGYAVGNAVEELKAVAYEVCDNIENNGVGKVLEGMVRNNG
ncbi:Cof-type HAD-IIB family hydrolase [[Acholeplasma] multilocale]|uniref:Cof-type HAD-IIB family hydrolase n=1 Tax=[Acholeplasma] multilocale TaxID=264638 RepID=UPI00047B5679|nr:Cof-type HAD-IIB family hydrolase [[Acholeplasma] multilocale]